MYNEKLSKIIKDIRVARGISIVEFAFLLEISPSYLSLIENNKKPVKANLVKKVLRKMPDLTIEEKNQLQLALKKNETMNIKEIQKYIMSLIQDFFYRIKNGITKGIEKLATKIAELVQGLGVKFRTNEMNGFI